MDIVNEIKVNKKEHEIPIEASITNHKNFSNWVIKGSMINNAVQLTKTTSLLDLASGVGNDLNRWSISKLKRVLGIDISKEQVTEAYNRLKTKRDARTVCSICFNRHENFEMDCYYNPDSPNYRSNYKLEVLEKNRLKMSKGQCVICKNSTHTTENCKFNPNNPKYINFHVSYAISSIEDNTKIKDIFKLFNFTTPVGLITNNYALNYINDMDNFLKMVSELLIEGGLFIGTAMDGDIINAYCTILGPIIDTRLYYIDMTINKDLEIDLNKRFHFNSLNKFIETCPKVKNLNKYSFKLKTNSGYFTEECTENVVYKKDFINVAKKNNLIPVKILKEVPSIFNFMDYPIENKIQRPSDIATLYFGFSFMKKTTKGLIVIPYRNRSEQLKILLDRLYSSDIAKYNNILIVEQSMSEGFNRGLLLNIGIKSYEQYCKEIKLINCNVDYYILHDVDLIPDEELEFYYLKYPKIPIHIGAYGQRYSNDVFFLGGILSISKDDYYSINGFPNQFNKWGGEDEVLRNRILDKYNNKGFQIEKPIKGQVHDLENLDIPQKLETLGKNKIDKVTKIKWKENDKLTQKSNGINTAPVAEINVKYLWDHEVFYCYADI